MDKYSIGDRVKIIGNAGEDGPGIAHCYKKKKICKVIGLAGWGEDDDALLLIRHGLKQAVSRVHVAPAPISWHTLLYRGIMGAIFGPESYAVNRYSEK